MRLRVRKPKNGRTSVVIDDRRGPTGLYEILDNVSVDEMSGLVKPVLEKWERVRAAIKEAKRPKDG